MNAILRGNGTKVAKKLQSTPSMGAAMATYLRQREQTEAIQRAEREEATASRPAVKRAYERARTNGEEPEYVDHGPIRVLARDGLLWLIAKGRLSASLRDAAERYRKDYALVHGGQLRSCIDPTVRGRGAGDALDDIIAATRSLNKVRKDALMSDTGFVWIMDEVAGKGTTIRSLAGEDDYRATVLEVEFRCACRLLARHYGLST